FIEKGFFDKTGLYALVMDRCIDTFMENILGPGGKPGEKYADLVRFLLYIYRQSSGQYPAEDSFSYQSVSGGKIRECLDSLLAKPESGAGIDAVLTRIVRRLIKFSDKNAERGISIPPADIKLKTMSEREASDYFRSLENTYGSEYDSYFRDVMDFLSYYADTARVRREGLKISDDRYFGYEPDNAEVIGMYLTYLAGRSSGGDKASEAEFFDIIRFFTFFGTNMLEGTCLLYRYKHRGYKDAAFKGALDTAFNSGFKRAEVSRPFRDKSVKYGNIVKSISSGNAFMADVGLFWKYFDERNLTTANYYLGEIKKKSSRYAGILSREIKELAAKGDIMAGDILDYGGFGENGDDDSGEVLTVLDLEPIFEKAADMAPAAEKPDLTITENISLIKRISEYLGAYPVDINVDLALIPPRDIDESLRIWAYIMVLHERGGMDINYLFAARKGILSIQYIPKLYMYIEEISSEYDMDPAKVKSRINIPHNDINTIKVDILSLSALNEMKDIPEEKLLVALDGESRGDMVPLMDFVDAVSVALIQAACLKTAKQDKDSAPAESEALKGVISALFPKFKSIYQKRLSHEIVTPKTLFNMIFDPDPDVRKDLYIALALPPLAEMAAEFLIDAHETLREFLRSA
ncbi:MAG: hypothetical protein ABH883_03825, partial [Candidatus Omnitrophota bacterium]